MKSLPVALATLFLLGSAAAQAMEIRVKTMDSGVQSIQVEPSDTVDRLKVAIQEKFGVPPEQQRLIFGGRQLDGRKTIAECRIKPGDLVFLLPALRGG